MCVLNQYTTPGPKSSWAEPQGNNKSYYINTNTTNNTSSSNNKK